VWKRREERDPTHLGQQALAHAYVAKLGNGMGNLVPQDNRQPGITLGNRLIMV
jgi:hypothetical protein